MILGIAGIVLPLLPTTPFILLASACFMRGSPAFHRWLHEHKTFGPMLENWHKHRAVTRKVKQRGAVFAQFYRIYSGCSHCLGKNCAFSDANRFTELVYASTCD